MKENTLPAGYNYRPLLDSLFIGNSSIEGNGLFCRNDIPCNSNLGISHYLISDELIRTPLSGFLNHSSDPNCRVVRRDDKVFVLFSIKDITSGSALTNNYHTDLCGINYINKK